MYIYIYVCIYRERIDYQTTMIPEGGASPNHYPSCGFGRWGGFPAPNWRKLGLRFQIPQWGKRGVLVCNSRGVDYQTTMIPEGGVALNPHPVFILFLLLLALVDGEVFPRRTGGNFRYRGGGSAGASGAFCA